MLLMATVGLTFAWYTTSVRRSRDHEKEQTDPATLHDIVLSPAALAALGHLPADVNAILGLHAAECMAQENGKRFLQALRGRLALPAGPRLDSLTGLPWDQIDHVVLGVRIEDRLLPRFTLVVRSRQKFDQDLLVKSLKAQRKDHGKRTLYSFPLEGFGIDGTFLDAGRFHTLVISRAPEDFDPVPLTPSPGIASDSMQTCNKSFVSRCPAGIVLWLAAATRNGEQVLAPLAQFGVIATHDVEDIAALRRLGIWLRAEGKVEAAADAELSDDRSASRFKAYLARLGLATGQTPTGLESNPQTQGLSSQLKKSLIVEQKDSHLSLTASCTMDAFIEATLKGAR